MISDQYEKLDNLSLWGQFDDGGVKSKNSISPFTRGDDRVFAANNSIKIE